MPNKGALDFKRKPWKVPGGAGRPCTGTSGALTVPGVLGSPSASRLRRPPLVISARRGIRTRKAIRHPVPSRTRFPVSPAAHFHSLPRCGARLAPELADGSLDLRSRIPTSRAFRISTSTNYLVHVEAGFLKCSIHADRNGTKGLGFVHFHFLGQSLGRDASRSSLPNGAKELNRSRFPWRCMRNGARRKIPRTLSTPSRSRTLRKCQSFIGRIACDRDAIYDEPVGHADLRGCRARLSSAIGNLSQSPSAVKLGDAMGR